MKVILYIMNWILLIITFIGIPYVFNNDWLFLISWIPALFGFLYFDDKLGDYEYNS